MTGSITETIRERQATHGDFFDTALIAQQLKTTLRTSNGWNKMSAPRKESLDAIAMKIARILSGDDTFADHWVDIEGYARLGREAVR